ncbi:MAG: PAS-domain containing protein [Caldimonas sp.]
MDPLIIEQPVSGNLPAALTLNDELSTAVRRTVLELDAITGWRCSALLFSRTSGCVKSQTAPHLPGRFCDALAAICTIGNVQSAVNRVDSGPTSFAKKSVGRDFLDRVRVLADCHGLSFCGSAPVWDGTGAMAGWAAAFGDRGNRSSPSNPQPIERAAQLLAIAIEQQLNRERQATHDAWLFDKTRTLEATFERMEEGLMVVSPTRIVELCNRRATELLDLPLDLMRTKPPFEVVLEHQWSKGDFSLTPDHIREFVRAGGILDTPQRYQRTRPNGRVIEVHSVPLEGGGVLRTYTDVTDRERNVNALRESEERLQRALDASHLALWDLDMTTGEVYLSDTWAEMLGSPRCETRTSFEALAASVPDDDQLRVAQAMSTAFRNLNVSYSVEHRVRRPDGQMLWVHSQGRAVEIGADGRVRRAVGTNRDITESKRSEAAQRSLEDQLRESQRLEAVGTLAGGIAHDFNNIIAAILGNVMLARAELRPDHPAQTSLKQIEKAGQRARSVVRQILTFSRQQQEERFTVSLRPIVEETVSMLRSVVSESVTVRTILTDQRLAVTGNPTQLQQVLMNLVTNASQALREGTGSITIGLEECLNGPPVLIPPLGLPTGAVYAHIWVRDDGIGMSEETQRRIFEPFFTTKAVVKGTGLGLAVVLGIVQAHAGSIGVTSAVGQGSTFDLYLPLVDSLSAPMPLEPSGDMVARGRGEHVLYVDDDEVMVLMVEGLLKRLGYRATCTLNAREAIEIASRDFAAVDVVVSDYNMPHCSGLDLALALSKVRPRLPVAISSGYVSDELRARAKESGVFAILQKERTLEDLGDIVFAALESTRRRSQ